MKFFFNLFLLLSFTSFSQTLTNDYINDYKDLAVEEMKLYNIPASITLSQGILESSNGESMLATKANNHFGIKCHSSWQGDRVFHDDDEKGECFRKYNNVEDSYRDHSLFLANSSRYSFLFDIPIQNYKSWAKGLKKAGYATNPKYSKLLINIIKRYNLDQYDKTDDFFRKFYFSSSYGLPYLYGIGINYINKKYYLSLDLNSSYVYLNKLSVSYNYKLYKKIYFGLNTGVLYINSNQKLDFGIKLSHLDDLSNKKRNKKQLISCGLNIATDDVFDSNSFIYIPSVSISYLF
jgi:hypothetical protein|tara:strand:+ start:514 stop:1389 length:876 start_codon:yes stop_codon:yes gene_type:complete